MRRTRHVLVMVGCALLFSLLVAPAWGDFPGPVEGTSKGEKIEFTFGEVIVKCAKDTDKYVIRDDSEAQVPTTKGHLDIAIFFEECQAVGIGHVENFECNMEFKPRGTAKFKTTCTINIECCLIQIAGPPENQNLGTVSYVNIGEKAVEITADLTGITYSSEGPCSGIKIAKKASNGVFKDPEIEEGTFLDGIQCTNVTGSGSVLQAALLGVYTKTFKSECEVQPTVEYKSSESEQALKQWGSETAELNGKESGNGVKVDEFIASDLPPESGQIKAMDKAGKGKEAVNGMVTTPVAQSAVALLVSLRATCSANTAGKPRVKATPLEEEWFANKGTLEALVENASITGCATSEAPKLIVRKDSAGATAGFKRYLNEVNKTDWAKFVKVLKLASNKAWPGKISESGVGGEAEAKSVYTTPNSMGYADLADAKAVGFSATPTLHESGGEKYYSFFVEVQNNKEGEAKYASPEVVESEVSASNCGAATYSEPEAGVAPDVDWSNAGQSNSLSGTAYPICTLTYDLAWQHYSYLGQEIFLQEQYADTVENFLEWVLKTGQEEKTLKSDHLAPLASALAKKAASAVKTSVGL